MQSISAEPLVQKFKNGTFQQSEIGPYFMAHMIFTAAFWIPAPHQELTLWDSERAVALVVITVFGVLHLKKQNLDTFGNDFASKYFCLGWVISVRRLLLFSVPAVLSYTGILGEAEQTIRASLVIVCEIIYYWWLGSLFAQSNQTQT
jgi:hypothetical protein